ncbi:hypothetical protein F2Q70_00044523 [Brassica cretica]|uniref:Uncharacterized protein n=1 Tax=Brassica cretica TaxID=69181 RepID=A0A8S9KG38_BRACR|nr:hypothetical protein F2Q70_00044523 [Brassica cretica]
MGGAPPRLFTGSFRRRTVVVAYFDMCAMIVGRLCAVVFFPPLRFFSQMGGAPPRLFTGSFQRRTVVVTCFDTCAMIVGRLPRGVLSCSTVLF